MGKAFTAANTEFGVEVARVTALVAFPRLRMRSPAAWAPWVVAIPKNFGWSCFEKRAANTPRIGRSAANPVTLLTAGEVPDVPQVRPRCLPRHRQRPDRGGQRRCLSSG